MVVGDKIEVVLRGGVGLVEVEVLRGVEES